MVCALVLALCWIASRKLGVGFDDVFDEFEDPRVADALLLLPLI